MCKISNPEHSLQINVTFGTRFDAIFLEMYFMCSNVTTALSLPAEDKEAYHMSYYRKNMVN